MVDVGGRIQQQSAAKRERHEESHTFEIPSARVVILKRMAGLGRGFLAGV